MNPRRFVGDYLFPRSPVRVTVRQFILRHPLGFAARFYIRRFRNFIAGYRLKVHPIVAEAHLGRVARHNLGSLWRVNRSRTEVLANVLPSIPGLDRAKSRVLVIGPRNEAELLLLCAYGFSLENLKAIDLFSVSPLIELMDMHHLEFQDGAFDLVYASYVLAYSDNLAQAAKEIRRVVRDDGLVAVSFVVPRDEVSNVVGLKALRGRLPELHRVFDVEPSDVLWRAEEPVGNEIACSSICRLSPRP